MIPGSLQGFLSLYHMPYCAFWTNLIAWGSKWQPIISKSAIQAEYWAIGYTIAKSIWIRKLLYDFGIVLDDLFVSIMTMSLQLTCQLIRFCMIVVSNSQSITTFFTNGLLLVILLFIISLRAYRLLICSQKDCHPNNFYFCNPIYPCVPPIILRGCNRVHGSYYIFTTVQTPVNTILRLARLDKLFIHLILTNGNNIISSAKRRCKIVNPSFEQVVGF